MEESVFSKEQELAKLRTLRESSVYTCSEEGSTFAVSTSLQTQRKHLYIEATKDVLFILCSYISSCCWWSTLSNKLMLQQPRIELNTLRSIISPAIQVLGMVVAAPCRACPKTQTTSSPPDAHLILSTQVTAITTRVTVTYTPLIIPSDPSFPVFTFA